MSFPARIYSTGIAYKAGATGNTKAVGSNGLIVDFPAMPDVLTLAREASYNAPVTPLHPDGVVHVYEKTNLLTIPLSFKIDSRDERYCKNGPVDLLWIAAALQAFTLPMTYGMTTTRPLPRVPIDQRGLIQPRDEFNLSLDVEKGQRNFVSARNGVLRWPTLAVLDLLMCDVDGANAASADQALGMLTGTNTGLVAAAARKMDTAAWGLRLPGYVRSVECRLFGPWVQVQYGGANMRNLPTRGEFSISFVHAPNYRNVLSPADAGAAREGAKAADKSTADAIKFAADGSAKVETPPGQAYAEFVRDNFYNTVALLDGSNATSHALVLEASNPAATF